MTICWTWSSIPGLPPDGLRSLSVPCRSRQGFPTSFCNGRRSFRTISHTPSDSSKRRSAATSIFCWEIIASFHATVATGLVTSAARTFWGSSHRHQCSRLHLNSQSPANKVAKPQRREGWHWPVVSHHRDAPAIGLFAACWHFPSADFPLKQFFGYISASATKHPGSRNP